MVVVAREPRANAAFLRLPRSGQPPRPRPVRRRRAAAAATRQPGPLPPGLAGRHHRGARGGPAHPGEPRRLHRRVQPWCHQEHLRPRPRRQRVRGDVDAAQGQLGRLRQRGAGRAAGPARRGTPLGRRPHGRRARPGGRVMTRAFAPPVVATYGTDDPAAPLVVLLHGRGSNEQEILGLAAHLPTGPAYAAVRAPIAEGGGFAWFANRGIGRPVAESLRDTMDWFRAWLDEVAPDGPAGGAGRLQRRRRLRRRPGARRPVALRRRRDPLRHPALRRRPRHRPRPAGQPAGRSWPRATATTSSLASSSTAPGATCSPSPARPPSPSASPVATSSPPRPPTSSATGSPTGSPSSTTTVPPRPDHVPDVRWPTLPGGELPDGAAPGPR